MTIKFLMDGTPAGDSDMGENYRRSWYLFEPDGVTVVAFAQTGANNLQPAIVAAQRIQAADSDAGDIWISTDPQPPTAGWPV